MGLGLNDLDDGWDVKGVRAINTRSRLGLIGSAAGIIHLPMKTKNSMHNLNVTLRLIKNLI